MLKNIILVIMAICTIYCVFNGLIGNVFKQAYTTSSNVVKTIASTGESVANKNGLKSNN